MTRCDKCGTRRCHDCAKAARREQRLAVDIPVGIPPCETCSIFEQCRKLSLACRDLRNYVVGRRLSSGSRTPERRHFEQIFAREA